MKRKDIIAGERYVDSGGNVFEVVSNKAGAEVVDGEFVVDHKMRKRYMGPEKGYKDYATNTKVPAFDLGVKPKEPVAVEPRDLVMTKAEWDEKQSTLQAERAKLTAEQKGWEKAFKDATGLTGHLHFQFEGEGAIVVSLSHLKRKGIKPEVKT